MDRAYFLRYYEFEENHWWFRARAEILKDYIRHHCAGVGALKILNVGAATGGSIAWLEEFGTVTSLEYDHDSVTFIREHLKADVIEGSILSLPFSDNAFDLVCAFDVIEHVEDDQQAVRELGRVVNSGGSVLVTVPAHMHLWSPHDEVNHHYRRYDTGSLQHLWQAMEDGKLRFMTYFNHYFYLPITVVRKMNNLYHKVFPSKNRISDFESFAPGLLNPVLFSVMAGEKRRVSAQRAYRTGVSILAHWQKD